jgi:hypothetical protein
MRELRCEVFFEQSVSCSLGLASNPIKCFWCNMLQPADKPNSVLANKTLCGASSNSYLKVATFGPVIRHGLHYVPEETCTAPITQLGQQQL